MVIFMLVVMWGLCQWWWW